MLNFLHMHERHLPATNKMPILFFSHGSPMHLIRENSYTESFKEISKLIPTPHRIIIVSAHNNSDQTSASLAFSYKEHHDFSGFPDELYNISYRANGAPDLADILNKEFPFINLNNDDTLDHGAYAPLLYLFPHGNIPVLSVTIDNSISHDELLDKWSTLQSLRKLGVMFIFSGNTVHNLHLINFMPNAGAHLFATQIQDTLTRAVTNKDKRLIANIHNDPNFPLAHPTDEHFRPLVAFASLLSPDDIIKVFNNDIDLGSIGMASYLAL